jgi:hypothetical protein
MAPLTIASFIIILFLPVRIVIALVRAQSSFVVAKVLLLFITVNFVTFLLFGTVGAVTIYSDFLGIILLTPIAILDVLVFCAPTLFLKWFVVPLAMPRVAYWTTQYCWPLGLIRELSAGGAMYAALALARGKSSAQRLDWVEHRVERSLSRSRSVHGAGIVAAGLIAALRGDRHLARCFLLVADTLDSRFISRSARAVARDWLVVDAALIGNWREVIRLGRRGRDSMRWSYAVSRIAERLSGDKQAGDTWLLWLCWIVAPRRRGTLALLRRALALPRLPTPSTVRLSACTDLPQALANLAHRLQNTQAHDDLPLIQAVRDIDSKIDSADTRALIQGRLAALSAQHDTDAVISAFRQSLANIFVSLIETSPALGRQTDQIAVLREAREGARRRLFRDIEAQCKDYDLRIKRQNALGALAEWELWARLRDRADRLLLVDPASENVLFETMKFPVCNFAVFQHNTCKRIALAHEMYTWLRGHSHSDPAISQLLLKNIRAAARASGTLF